MGRSKTWNQILLLKVVGFKIREYTYSWHWKLKLQLVHMLLGSWELPLFVCNVGCGQILQGQAGPELPWRQEGFSWEKQWTGRQRVLQYRPWIFFWPTSLPRNLSFLIWKHEERCWSGLPWRISVRTQWEDGVHIFWKPIKSYKELWKSSVLVSIKNACC